MTKEIQLEQGLLLSGCLTAEHESPAVCETQQVSHVWEAVEDEWIYLSVYCIYLSVCHTKKVWLTNKQTNKKSLTNKQTDQQ